MTHAVLQIQPTSHAPCCFHAQVLAAVFGPHEADTRGAARDDRAIIKCEYSMAAFSTGARIV